MNTPLGYGLIGCGGFGSFCLEQYRKMDEIRCIAVADSDPTIAAKTAAGTGTEACASPEALLARNDIDIVHIATPPFTHAALTLAALKAGKHVLCEKPLAITHEDARALAAFSTETQRLLAVNLIMRYNPLCEVIKTITEQRLLGEPLHAHFLNDAKDEQLPPGHWFWEREKSGGIFIEHGVHFFDLFSWWFGPGKVLAAQQTLRPGSSIVEQMHCTLSYGESMLVDFYHGFHQAARMDRQEWTLTFEMGSISLREWVPTQMHIDLLADDAVIERLVLLLPTATVREVERYRGASRLCSARHKPREIDGRFSISGDAGLPKMDLYGYMLRALLQDQIAYLRDPSHVRRTDESNGVTSLEPAVIAQRLADGVGTDGNA